MARMETRVFFLRQPESRVSFSKVSLLFCSIEATVECRLSPFFRL